MRLRAHHCTNFAEKFVQSVKNGERPAPRRGDDFKCAPRLPGCGTQHPLRALGGTCVLLAAAPTTPPCFRHWRRSSSLLRIISGKIIFICSFETPAGVSKLLFHGRGRKVKRHLQRRFLRKRGTAGENFLTAFSGKTLSVIAVRCQRERTERVFLLKTS